MDLSREHDSKASSNISGASISGSWLGRKVILYGLITLSVALMTLLMRWTGMAFDTVNAALVFLFPVLFGAVYGGRRMAVYAACIGILAFDFFFIPPVWSFTVADLRYLISFAVYLAVALMTANLADRLKRQAAAARQQEQQTAALYQMTRRMSELTEIPLLLDSFGEHMRETYGIEVLLYVPSGDGELQPAAAAAGRDEREEQAALLIARWVYRHGEPAGHGTGKLAEAAGWFLPLRAEEQTYGVAAFYEEAHEDPVVRIQLEALAGVAGGAIARIQRGEAAKLAQLTAESERMRTALLDSVSHELRTPLAAIIGSSTGLLEAGALLGEEDRAELLGTIRDGALRMNRLVTNLLGMVQLESGMLKLRREWLPVDELLGVALRQLKEAQGRRRILYRLPEDLPPVPGDIVLLEQMLVNVLSNAIKYSPDGSVITIEASQRGGMLQVEIKDEGSGLSVEEGKLIFDKFYRSQATRHIPGTGLGLSICRGIADMHGGSITAGPAGERGAVVTILLPLQLADDSAGGSLPEPDPEHKYKGEHA